MIFLLAQAGDAVINNPWLDLGLPGLAMGALVTLCTILLKILTDSIKATNERAAADSERMTTQLKQIHDEHQTSLKSSQAEHRAERKEWREDLHQGLCSMADRIANQLQQAVRDMEKPNK